MARTQCDRVIFDYFHSLTDCVHFLNGICRFGRTCRYRHFSEVRRQLIVCVDWPDRCRRIQCRFQHPATPIVRAVRTLNLSSSSNGSPVGFFWNMKKVPILEGQNAFDIIQRIRQKLVIERHLQEVEFTCYCDIDTISEENHRSLQYAMVTIAHVPDHNTETVDRHIILHLDRFERTHRPPATIVLISDDIDFVDRLNDLRHYAGFHIIVVRNRLASAELKATVNEHYSWTLFTREPTTLAIRELDCNNCQSIANSKTNDYLVNEKTPRQSPLSFYRTNHRQIKSATSLSPDSDQSTFPLDYHNSNGSTETNGRFYHPIQYENGERSQRIDIRECAFCQNEFNDIQALRQHQVDQNHLYDCPVCKQSFFTYEEQFQHRVIKGHDSDQDSNTSDDEPSQIDQTTH